MSAAETKAPKILQDIISLTATAPKVVENAQAEFNALNEMTKVQATAQTPKLISDSTKIPEAIKVAIKEIELEFKELKELQEELSKPTFS